MKKHNKISTERIFPKKIRRMKMYQYSSELIKGLNEDISQFPNVFPIEEGMEKTLTGVSRLVMLDRYTQKDMSKKTLKVGDLVVVTIKDDPKFPATGTGYIRKIDGQKAHIELDEEYADNVSKDELVDGNIVRSFNDFEKPLELYYEQISKRNSKHLAGNEENHKEWADKFYHELSEQNFVPAGRVLYGAGSGAEVTYFNCYVMPFVQE